MNKSYSFGIDPGIGTDKTVVGVFSAPPQPSATLLDILKHAERFNDKLTGADTVLMSSEGYRTMQGMMQMREQAEKPLLLKARQVGMSFMNMQIIADKYMPEFRRVQFRFPRSKKARMRKKWAKNPANFREERFAYLVNMEAINRGMRRYMDAAVLHNFTLFSTTSPFNAARTYEVLLRYGI